MADEPVGQVSGRRRGGGHQGNQGCAVEAPGSSAPTGTGGGRAVVVYVVGTRGVECIVRQRARTNESSRSLPLNEST